MQWKYELIKSTEKLSHYICLDHNIYRPFKREIEFWNNLAVFAEQEYPMLFENVDFIFTPSQLLEEVDQGEIISKIKQSNDWKNKISGKTILPTYTTNTTDDNLYKAIANAFDKLFNIIYDIIKNMDKLKRDSLLNKINTNIMNTHMLKQNF